MSIDKRLNDLENKLTPESTPSEVITITWGEDDDLIVKRRPLAPGEVVKPGICVNWSVEDDNENSDKAIG